MQKISAYLYPNRIELLLDSSTFNVEYTNVFQRNIKIYQGIDNVIEFDIKNADQKRVDLLTLTDIQMIVMDQEGNELPSSPYVVTPSNLRGIATTIIPYEDLRKLTSQFLRYSVTATLNNQEILLYADARFTGSGTIELATDIRPKKRSRRIYDTFTAEIDLRGYPIHHSSAIPVTFYEAIPTARMNFDIYVRGFVGSIWLEATTRDAISHEAFKALGKPWGAWTQQPQDGLFTGIIPYGYNIPILDYTYLRVSFSTPTINGQGANFQINNLGSAYQVKILQGGTGYSLGSMIKIPGSQLGGQDDINDLMITVTGLDTGGSGTAPSSYMVSSITGVRWQGMPSARQGTYMATGYNYNGVVEKIEVYC